MAERMTTDEKQLPSPRAYDVSGGETDQYPDIPPLRSVCQKRDDVVSFGALPSVSGGDIRVSLVDGSGRCMRWGMIATVLDAVIFVCFVVSAGKFAYGPPSVEERGSAASAWKKCTPMLLLFLRAVLWVIHDCDYLMHGATRLGVDGVAVAAREAAAVDGAVMLAHLMQVIADAILERVKQFGPELVVCVCIFAAVYVLYSIVVSIPIGNFRGTGRVAVPFVMLMMVWLLACPLAMRKTEAGGVVLGLVSAAYMMLPTLFCWAASLAAFRSYKNGAAGTAGSIPVSTARKVWTVVGAALFIVNSAIFVFSAADSSRSAMTSSWYTPVELSFYWAACAIVSYSLAPARGYPRDSLARIRSVLTPRCASLRSAPAPTLSPPSSSSR